MRQDPLPVALPGQMKMKRTSDNTYKADFWLLDWDPALVAHRCRNIADGESWIWKGYPSRQPRRPARQSNGVAVA